MEKAILSFHWLWAATLVHFLKFTFILHPLGKKNKTLIDLILMNPD